MKTMNPIQQKIKESLDFDKNKAQTDVILSHLFDIVSKNQRKNEDNSIDFNKAKPELVELLNVYKKQSQLELLEVLKGEIEKLERYEAFETYTGAGCFEDKNGDYLYRQDVLNLLKNNQE